MASLEPKQLLTQLEKGVFSPLYCLHGEETFMMDEALDKLRVRVLSDGLSDFNLNIFYANDCSMAAIQESVETLPMMAERRLVIVKQAHDLTADEQEKLLPLIEKPVLTTSLVFLAIKIDLRRKFFKLFESQGVMVKFQKPYDNQIPSWIHYIAKKHGKTITADAVEMIKSSVGNNLADLNNEILKVTQFIGDRAEIGAEDIKSVVSRFKPDTVFELVNAMGRGDCVNSFVHLAHLLDSGQNEIGVLSMIIRHFRILILCQEAVRGGLTFGQIAQRVGVNGYFVRDYVDQAKRHDGRKLVEIYKVLLDTDRALKSNPLSSHIWLENLVIQACRPRQKESQIQMQ